MKTAIYLIAVMCGVILDVSSSEAVNWNEAHDLIDQIESNIATALLGVFNSSWDENKLIGVQIKAKIMPTASSAGVIVIGMKTATRLEKLSEEQAREDFEALVELYDGFVGSTREDFAKLSKPTQEKIMGILQNSFDNANKLILKLYDVLGNRI